MGIVSRYTSQGTCPHHRHAVTSNTLFYGDNLDILREYIADESVDLVYLDPPFNSSRNCNVLFKDEKGKDSGVADYGVRLWHWNQEAERAYNELVTETGGEVGTMIGAIRTLIGTDPMMAYLVMMATRLVELRRVLKPTGSLYLHCDQLASHYLKIILDTIFGAEFQKTKSPGNGRIPQVTLVGVSGILAI